MQTFNLLEDRLVFEVSVPLQDEKHRRVDADAMYGEIVKAYNGHREEIDKAAVAAAG